MNFVITRDIMKIGKNEEKLGKGINFLNIMAKKII